MTTRSARITTAAYVAVRIDHIAPETTIVPCTANKAIHIEGVNGGVVDLKAGEKFFLHRAASLGENMFYIVRLVAGAKKCTCAAKKPCRHEKAIAARLQSAHPMPAPIAVEQSAPRTFVTIACRRPAARAIAEAPLHGARNQGFHFMR